MLNQDVALFRPRGIGELFDQAIKLYRKNFLKFIGIIAVAQVPIILLQLVINVLSYDSTFGSGEMADPSVMFSRLGAQTVPTLLLALVSFVLVSGFATAALTIAITRSYLGEETTIEEAYEQIGGRWKSLLGALLLLLLFNIPVLIWAMIPCVGWLTGFGMLFFINMVISPLIAPIVITENRPSTQVLRRAWDLARRYFWRLAGYFLLLIIFSLLVVQGPVAALNWVLLSNMGDWFASGNSTTSYMFTMAIQSILTLFLSLLYTPLFSACATLAYFDLRIREEGLDLALAANQTGALPLPASAIASQAPALERTGIITWKEMGFFAGLSLLGVLLYTIPFMLLTLVMAALMPRM